LTHESLRESPATPWIWSKEIIREIIRDGLIVTRLPSGRGQHHISDQTGNPTINLSPAVLELKIRSELLSLELANQRGLKLDLHDPYGSTYPKKVYGVDPVSGARFSIGPDRLPGTKDDIRLE
jgi:hypothetical protein